MENIGEVARLTDYFLMSDGFEKCVEFLESKLTSENMAWGYQLAIMFNNQKLKEFCEKRISFFTDEVLKSDMLLKCDQKVVERILKIDTLNCNEANVFDACISWAKASCQRNELNENDSSNLRKQLGDCFHLIRFGAMDGKDIDKILSNKVFESLFTRDELVDIMRLKWNKTFESQTIKRAVRSKPLVSWDSNNILCCDLKNALTWTSLNMIHAHLTRMLQTKFSTRNISLLEVATSILIC